VWFALAIGLFSKVNLVEAAPAAEGAACVDIEGGTSDAGDGSDLCDTDLLCESLECVDTLTVSGLDGVCLICEYTGVTTSEANAISMFTGTAGHPCASPTTVTSKNIKIKELLAANVFTTSIADFCVAQFWIYKASDINKFIWGVKRFGATTSPAATQIDIEGYEGVKGYQMVGTRADGENKNPVFINRGSADNEYRWISDGREADAGLISTGAVTTTAVQTKDYTLCIKCHKAQEFPTPPIKSSDITNSCWNPSGSSSIATDMTSQKDPKKYCTAQTGICYTKTWTYHTERDSAITSYWVGVERGCADTVTDFKTSHSDINTDLSDHDTPRAATNMKMIVRGYRATNTASKAKDLAKYPDKSVSETEKFGALKTGASAYATGQTELNDAVNFPFTPSTPATSLLMMPTSLQYTSTDGTGAPDIPDSIKFPEIECLKCQTPSANTNGAEPCAKGDSTGRVKCKTLSCSAVLATYKLDESESAETYYYAKRGCTADPDDGVASGVSVAAERYVAPAGYTGITQTNQRSYSGDNGNTQRVAQASTAKIMDCYSCEVSMTHTALGKDISEPVYDSIKSQDPGLCWETSPPVTDSSIAATGTSGRCETSCFVKTYRYKQIGGTTANPTTTFNWYMKRGCLANQNDLVTGITPSKTLYSLQVQNYVCDYTDKTLCNDKLKVYDTNLELSTQTIRPLSCYNCATPEGNTDSTDACYTVPSSSKATECDDLSYVMCSTEQSAYNTSSTTSIYNIKRACAKTGAENGADITSDIPGISCAKSKTTFCRTNGCNKGVGTKGPLAVCTPTEVTTAPPEGATDAPVEATSGGKHRTIGFSIVGIIATLFIL
jgi:hypothetical protein